MCSLRHNQNIVTICALALFACGDDADGTTTGATETLETSDASASPSTSAGTSDAGTTSGAGTTTAPMTTTGATSSGDPVTGGSTGDEPPPARVPAFVAVGHVGRTIMSCDDGLTWVENHSYDLDGDPYVCDEQSPTRCWQDGQACSILNGESCEQLNPCDCDHHPGAAQGVAYGDEWFVATWGWGPPGSVRRSRDGINWELVVEGTTFGGVAHSGGRFLLGSREPILSADSGMSWEPGASADVMDNDQTIWNVRAVGSADYEEGRFVLTARDGENVDVLLSSTGGESWWRPEAKPAACAQQTRGITYGAGTILIVDGSGAACSSTNGGESWTTAEIGGGVDSSPLWTGEQFMAWGGQTAYSSPDGVNWSAQPVEPSVQIGAAAIAPQTGTIVAVRGGWNVWYEDQEFYRSADGLSWETLDAGAYTGSHPIRAIAFGYVDPSDACPSP